MNLRKLSSITLSLALALTFSFMGLEAASATTSKVKDNASGSINQITSIPQLTSSSVKVAAAKAKGKTVKAGSTSTVYNKSIVIVKHKKYGKVKTYFKIKPKTSGALTISTYAGSDVSVKGANAGYVRSRHAHPQYRYITFGVKKGKTYTVTVNSYGEIYYDAQGRQKIFNSVSFRTRSYDGKFGKSKKKAAKLSRKKERKGYIEPKGKAKYYKLSKKGRKVKITFKADTNERLQIKITGKAKRIKKYMRYDQTIRGGYNVKVLTIKLYGAARDFSGVIEVKRVGKSSGVYSIKYQ